MQHKKIPDNNDQRVFSSNPPGAPIATRLSKCVTRQEKTIGLPNKTNKPTEKIKTFKRIKETQVFTSANNTVDNLESLTDESESILVSSSDEILCNDESLVIDCEYPKL